MDHTDTKITDVAGKLTIGERRAILAANLVGELPKYTGRNKLGRAQPLTLPTIRNLQDTGLVSDYPYRLTPPGLRVRDYLRSNPA